jgi:hypothetical protein
MNNVKHSAEFQVNQPADIIFPLFSAEGEKLWVPGWDYENIMGTIELQEDYIFLTETHDHAATKAIWLVKRYQPDKYLIEFYKVEPAEKVGVIKVECSPLTEITTSVSVTYEYIALSEKGNAFIQHFSSQVYSDFITEWQRLLEAYFEQ